MHYEVVFPYKEIDNEWIRIEPKYNLITNECINFTNVNELYDTYEKAVDASKKLNRDILDSKIELIPINNDVDKELEKIIQSHKEKLSKYKELEETIEQKTSDLAVFEKPKKQSIIKVEKHIKTAYNISLYEIINLWSNKNYRVYSLTDDELSKLINSIKNNEIIDKYNKKCLLINNSEQRIVKINNYEKENECAYILSDNLYIKKNMNFEESECDLIFYTLETYEDVIKSFITKYNEEDELTLNNKVLAKRIKI